MLVRIHKSTHSTTIFDNDAASTNGRNWYSAVYDSTSGDVFINERDNGLILRYDPELNSWTNIPIVTNHDSPDNANISYPSGFTTEPSLIRLQEATHGGHTYDLSAGSFGEMKKANGYIWVLLNHSWDFDAEGNAILADQSFNGIKRINPVDNSVTQYSIAGSSALRGMTIDSVDSTILWITDNLSDKVYKFDTTSNTVTQTIDLPAGTKARSITNDSTTLYIAINKAGGLGENSKILSVTKTGLVTTEIDTGAGNTSTGTFFVDLAGTKLIWTDESAHIGTIDTTNMLKTVSNTSGSTSTNHFGAVVGSEYWIAGHGSAKVGIISLNSVSSSHSSSCAGDCYSPHFGIDENNKYFYSDGLTINDKSYQMDNVLHVHNDKKIITNVGEPVEFILKIKDTNPEQIKLCEIGYAIPKGHFMINDATFMLTMKKSFDGIVEKSMTGDVSAIKDVYIDFTIIKDTVYCSFTWTPTKHLINDMFAIQAIDQYNYNKITFINEGYQSVGLSLVGTPIFKVMDKYDHDKIKDIAVLDKTLVNQNIAIDENNNLWQQFDGKWQKELSMPDRTCNITKHGYDRYCNEFKAVMNNQESIARQYFDSDIIQAIMSPIIEKEPISYERLHDSIPNMIKAQTAFYQKDFNKVLKYSN